ncbi:MAG: alanine/ornithine racemase family PLP-dependent enzyme [Candidatus Izimaplasma sp.]|nr:alanine/ornithine racemase family PLP-dependent enzyme [Candidatus Izimaplasma bacterium]
MYPRIIVDLKKLKHNAQRLIDIAHSHNHSIMAVTKVFCADQKLIDVYNELNIDYLADSRIKNLVKMTTDHPKVLLRIPMISEIDVMVSHVEMSLNSELETIKKINQSAKRQDTNHKIILMIDLGDLREGIFNENELINTVQEIMTLEHITLEGVGTNLTCYGGIIPSQETLEKLVSIKVKIEALTAKALKIISGGNSSNLTLLMNGEIPQGINNIRLGESIVLGRESAYGNHLENTYDDVFTFEAEVIESKIKPSVPIGQIGMDAFGNTPEFEDKGIIRRVILGVGRQDVDHEELIPLDTVEVIGSSSDHIIVDVSHSPQTYRVGDTMKFKLTYGSILSLYTSQYIEKHYV